MTIIQLLLLFVSMFCVTEQMHASWENSVAYSKLLDKVPCTTLCAQTDLPQGCFRQCQDIPNITSQGAKIGLGLGVVTALCLLKIFPIMRTEVAPVFLLCSVMGTVFGAIAGEAIGLRGLDRTYNVGIYG